MITIPKKSLLCIILTFFLLNMACLVTERKYKIIFFGDSITFNGLSWKHGYINEIDSIIKSKGLENKYQLEESGIFGNKVADLYSRLDKDVIQYNPDAVVIYIGINDVNNGNPDIEADSFKKNYLAIIDKLKKKNIKVIICTPTVIGEFKNVGNTKDVGLNKYSLIIREIAKDYSLPLCDLRSIFIEYINKNNPINKENGILTVDGIHLNRAGNLLVANNLWKVINN